MLPSFTHAPKEIMDFTPFSKSGTVNASIEKALFDARFPASRCSRVFTKYCAAKNEIHPKYYNVKRYLNA